MVRKVTKTKGAFTSEDAVLKQIYLAIINAQTKWSGTMFAWSIVRRELTEYFGDRFSNADTVTEHSQLSGLTLLLSLSPHSSLCSFPHPVPKTPLFIYN